MGRLTEAVAVGVEFEGFCFMGIIGNGGEAVTDRENRGSKG